MLPRARHDARHIGELQRAQHQDEFRRGIRALLMHPLMAATHEDFGAVRRQADRLREWFAREAGWRLHVQRDGARLYKRPARLDDASRGLPGFDQRRYILFCLVCAVLERSDPQITLHVLGERVVQWAAEPTLALRGYEFQLRSAMERRELVTVCKTLLDLGVLQRVVGDEESYVQGGGAAQSDALYDIQRRMLAGLLAAARGPSTWPAGEDPTDFDARVRSLVAEHIADTEQGRRDAIRHQLARRLLDDPVVYLEALDPESQAYFANQRGAMAARLSEATGLTSEQRAEGVALTDDAGTLTDVSMPAEGTEAHATLLLAEHLAARLRQGVVAPIARNDLEDFLRESVGRFGRYWRKSAREPGAEKELAQVALDRLEKLQLIMRHADFIQPMPAIARFALGETDVVTSRGREQDGHARGTGRSNDLFAA
jgi:uncharacterized protein (TIGR02678 family)